MQCVAQLKMCKIQGSCAVLKGLEKCGKNKIGCVEKISHFISYSIIYRKKLKT